MTARRAAAALAVLGLAAAPASAQTVGTKTINQLPAAGPVTGNEVIPLVQNGLTKQTTVSALQALFAANPLANPLGFSLPGAPALSNLQQTVSDIGQFYAYGGIADGQPHLLQNVTSVSTPNGVVNTSGWSLAQWQALYNYFDSADTAKVNPPVTALTNELDEVALQALINTRKGNSAIGQTSIQLPTGTLRITRPIKSGCRAVSVVGNGGPATGYSTAIVQTTAGADGWHHGTSDLPAACQTVPFATFSMRGVALLATGAGGRAVDIVANRAVGMDIRDSSFTGVLANYTLNFWHDGVRCTNCSNSFLLNDSILGSYQGSAASGLPLTSMGAGLEIAGNGTGQTIVYSVNISSFDVGIKATSGQNTDLEGNDFESLNVNNVNRAFVITGSFVGIRSPMWFIRNGQFGNVAQKWLDINYVSDVTIDSNLVYATAPDFTFTATTSNGSSSITGVTGAPGGYAVATGQAIVGTGIPGTAAAPTTFVGAVTGTTAALVNSSGTPVSATASGTVVLRSAPAAPPVDFVNLNNNQRVTFTNNKMQLGGNNGNIGSAGGVSHNMRSVILAQFNANGAVGSVRLRDNFILDYGYTMIGAFVDGGGNSDLVETGTGFSAFNSGTQGAPKVFGATASGTGSRWGSYLGPLGCGVLGGGQLTCTTSVNGTLTAALEIPITFPVAFAAAPTVQADNGDINVQAGVCGVEAASVTTTGFTAKCPAGASGNPARIAYTATGP